MNVVRHEREGIAREGLSPLQSRTEDSDAVSSIGT